MTKRILIHGRRLMLTLALAVTTAGCSSVDWWGGEETLGIRRIAILPMAFADPAGGRSCDLCPADLALEPTTAAQARLVTGFFYEAMARHPRYQVMPDREVAQLDGLSMRAASQKLAAEDRVDAVLVGALVDLREREGRVAQPTQPAGAAIHSILVDVQTGEPVWAQAFDRNDGGPGAIKRRFDVMVKGQSHRWVTALGVASEGANELVENLVDKLDSEN